MNFSNAYIGVREHGKEVQTRHPAKLPALFESSQHRNSAALPSVKYRSIFRSESPDIVSSSKPRQFPDSCLLFTTFWRQNYQQIKRQCLQKEMSTDSSFYVGCKLTDSKITKHNCHERVCNVIDSTLDMWFALLSGYVKKPCVFILQFNVKFAYRGVRI
jgi:hypothetical protein